MSEIAKHTFLYNFLISPKLRILRYILLVLLTSVITLNQTLVGYSQNIEALGNNIYWIAFVSFIVYLIVTLLNLYIFIPKLLLKKKYLLYITALLGSVALPVILRIFMEYLSYSILEIPHLRSSYFNYVTLLDAASNFTVDLLCIVGISMARLLKYRILNSEKISQLEQIQMKSEVEQLKDQINPQFLFNILNRTSVLAKTDPKKASEMLLKLSQLLRYQLYDCSREKVLLNSEIIFLSNYLALQQLYANDFEYSISKNGDTNKVFTSPLIFIPFVQNIINQIRMQDKPSAIQLAINADGNQVDYIAGVDNATLSDSDLEGIKQRLRLLYKDNYRLSITQKNVELRLNSKSNAE